MIGINSQIESPNGGGNVGIGFAVPINTVRQVANQLLQDGKVEHAFLGHQRHRPHARAGEVLNLAVQHGALVQTVTPEAPRPRRASRAATETRPSTSVASGSRPAVTSSLRSTASPSTR